MKTAIGATATMIAALVFVLSVSHRIADPETWVSRHQI
jgi:hypothetical protein